MKRATVPFHFLPAQLLHYILKREADRLFASVAIRSLAIGMVGLFEPIYLYLYLGKSFPLTLLFFGAIHGAFGLLAVYGGKIMSKIGLKHSMLVGNFFYFGYFICLFFLYVSSGFLVLAVALKALGMTFFWPAFHIDFVRFSDGDHRGREIGKMNIAAALPAVFSPLIGGFILAAFNYPVLFIAVLLVLLASVIPLFLTSESYETYTDSYQGAWRRIFKKENRGLSLSLAAQSTENGVDGLIWPIFMSVIAIGYTAMGGLTSFALVVSMLFTLYIGRVTDHVNRIKLLRIGSVLTSIAWIIKYFVTGVFDAFLAQSFYKVCRTTASIPSSAFVYGKADQKGSEADEFIIYREIVVNLSLFFFFALLAVLFWIVPKINISFMIAALLSLGFMFLGGLPKIKKHRFPFSNFFRRKKNHTFAISDREPR